MIVEFHEAAQDEFDAAVAHYSAISEDLGQGFRTEAERAIQRIIEKPNAWKPIGPLRMYQFKRFPYGIVYRVHDGKVKVYAVMHLKRRPGYWRKRLQAPKQG